MEITILQYTDGALLHQMTADEPITNDEEIEFNYTKDGIDIENASFHVIWASQVNNNSQVVLVSYTEKSGKVIYPTELVEQMKIASQTLNEVSKRLLISSDYMRNRFFNIIIESKDAIHEILDTI